jgi:hypothetical protein
MITQNSRDLIWHIVIGVGISLAITIIPAILLGIANTEPVEFLICVLFIFLIGACIGGLFSHTMAKRANSRRRVLFLNIFSIAAIIFICISPFLFMFGVLFYAWTPWPSPKPYPGVQQVERGEGPTGSWGFVRSQTYRVDQPINIVKQYYEDEMDTYCVDDRQSHTIYGAELYTPPNRWGLDEIPLEHSPCFQLECSVRRWSMAQGFEVFMCSESEARTVVVQLDAWQD